MTPRSMTLWFDFDLEAKNSFFDFVATGGYCSVSQSPPWFFIRLSSDGTYDGMVMSVQVSVRPTLRPSGSPSARFSHFSPTCFDILSWNFAHDFVLMYYGSSASVVTLRQFWRSYASLWTQNIGNVQFFRTFTLYALTYWAEILHLIYVLMYYRSSSSVITLRQFLKELCLFVNLEHRKCEVVRTFLLHA